MLRTMRTSKIHRVTVTQADLHCVGSVTVDADNRVVGTDDDPAEVVPGMAADLLVRGDAPAAVAVAR